MQHCDRTSICSLSVSDSLTALRSHLGGLSENEAHHRLKEFGPNLIEEVRRFRLTHLIAVQFTHFFAVILWVSAALALIAEWKHPNQGMLNLAVAIFVVIVVNGTFSFWQEFRAERALAALKRLLPGQVSCMRDGRAQRVATSRIVPGDVIVLEQGARIPADCRVLSSNGCSIALAALTGESLPRLITSEPNHEQGLDCSNFAPAGATVSTGEARALVIATGMDTQFGQTARLAQATGEIRSPLQKEIIRASRRIAILATCLGVLFYVVGQSSGLSAWVSLLFAIGIMVANVPEGLLPTVSLSLAMATQRMAKENALVRQLASVEALGSTTVICTDKTGTLTLNEMRVDRVYIGMHWVDDDGLRVESHSLGKRLLEAALLCHQLRAGADPMEKALVDFAKTHGFAEEPYKVIDVIPFDAKRRRSSVVVSDPEGERRLYCKGAPESVLPLCTAIWRGSGKDVKVITESGRREIQSAVEIAAKEGLRVLALAFRPLGESSESNQPQPELERDLIFAGMAGIRDAPRPEVPGALRKCSEAGIRVLMITGDHPVTAKAIGEKIGLYQTDPQVITGERLSLLSDQQLQLTLRNTDVLFARTTPEQKLRIVRVLQRSSEVVAMTGDGVNDAPALRAADVGVAMGKRGTDVAREAADVVLLDDNFATIVRAIEEGRIVYENIRKFLTYILTSNVPEAVPYLTFVLFKIPLPLTVPQILAVDLGTDLVPALGLGAEKGDPNIMKRPPRSRSQRLLNRYVLVRSYLYLGLLEAAAGMTAYVFVMTQGTWDLSSLTHYSRDVWNYSVLQKEAQTACLSAIVVMQTMNVLISRNFELRLSQLNPLSNQLIVIGLVFEWLLILVIDYTPLGNALFGTHPISFGTWLIAVPFAVAMLVAEILRRVVQRHAFR